VRRYQGVTIREADAQYYTDWLVATQAGWVVLQARWDTTQATPTLVVVYAPMTAGQSPDAEPPKRRRDPLPPKLRFKVLMRDGFRCRYCGKGGEDGAVLHVDHIIPVSKGGGTVEENLVAACEECNLGKGTMDVV
jgi:hypothetical protein